MCNGLMQSVPEFKTNQFDAISSDASTSRYDI